MKIFVLFACIIAYAATDGVSLSTYPIFVVLGFDGFRPEYLQRGHNPILQQLIVTGSTTVRMRNQMPTLTFTNFYSIATGTYPETHGVLGKQTFTENGECVGYGEELYSYNKNITPIWTLNELSGQGRHSGVMMWSSSEFPNHKILPTFLEKLEKNTPWEQRIDTVVSWLVDEKTPANLILAYFEEPDALGHWYGPDSNHITESLQQVDNTVSHYLHQLRQRNIIDKVNTIILSDHGMTSVSNDTLIDLNQILNSDEYSLCGSTPGLQIQPKPGFEKKILDQLRQASKQGQMFDVYERDSIPSDWHYKNNKRQAAIYVQGREPYIFADAISSAGAHGYDRENPDMFPIFIANGPVFKRNYTSPSFENIDIYPLISSVLNLKKPEVPVNGTITVIGNMLKSSMLKEQLHTPTTNYNSYLLVVLIAVICIVGIIGLVIFLRQRKKLPRMRFT